MTEVNILDYIPVGKENAIPRHELKELLDLSDRDMREMIHKECIRQQVLVIGKQSSGGGYYKPKNTDEIREFIAQEHSRAMAILMNVQLAKAVEADMERGVYNGE